MDNAIYYSAIAGNQEVDSVSGVIRGVSVITIGEAQGHGSYIDKTTLSQVRSVAAGFPDGIKVKLSDKKGHDGDAGQIVGSLRNFRLDGNRVRADLHLLKSDPNFSKIVEMAKEMPSAFGLSVVVPNSLEKIEGKDYLRCEDIYSIDLVESPAANPTGLFSKPTNTPMSIKFANGKDGDHAKDCDCKECMSKNSKKGMSAFVADLLGLSADADEATIKAAFTKVVDLATKPPEKKPESTPIVKLSESPEFLALSKKLDETTTALSGLTAANANALALAKKAEIDSLVSEAARDGKVIPLEADDLYTVKDGICTIGTEPAKLSKIIAKLPKSQISLSRTKPAKPTDAEGKPIEFDRHTPEGRAKTIAFCRTRQAEGAAALGRRILEQASNS